MHAFTKRLQGYGRFGDKLLTHLSPKEAKILKKAGGAGTVNPFTGALEYYKGTLGGGGVNPLAGDAMPGDETTSDPVNQPSTMSTDKPQAKDAFLNLANTWQSNQPEEADKGLDPRMLNFAKIMQNTFDRDDPGTEGELRAEYYEGSRSIENMLKYTQGISNALHNKLIDRGVDNEWNEDKAPGRVDEVLSYMFRKNDDGINAFEFTGGEKALMEAYDQLGITGEGKSYADKHVNALKKLGEDLSQEFGTGQTSMTMGEEKGPEFAGEFTGSWSDAFTQITESLAQVLPYFSPTAAFTTLGMAGVNAIKNPKVSFQMALGEALGFGDAQHGFRLQDISVGMEDDDDDDSFGGFGSGGGGE
tara:strand:- start:1000 stop:2079 length:1080 start_codon:yes stop_codon:yes gene_type:complete